MADIRDESEGTAESNGRQNRSGIRSNRQYPSASDSVRSPRNTFDSQAGTPRNGTPVAETPSQGLATPSTGMRQAGSRRQSLSQRHGAESSSQVLPTPNVHRARRGDMGQFQSQSFPRRFGSMPLTPGNNGRSGGDTNMDGIDEEEGEDMYVWGTNLTIASVTKRVRDFYTTFRGSGLAQTEEAKYEALIRQAMENQEVVINVDCADIASTDPILYSNLIAYPTEVIPLMDQEAQALASSMDDGQGGGTALDLQVKTFNLQELKVIRDMNPFDINRLISVSGMVTRTSSIIPDLTVATFGCEVCGAEEMVPAACGRLAEPVECTSCAKKWTMKLLHNRCFFLNRQLIKMQENPNAIPEGETPHAVSMNAFDALLDVCKPGDRVTVTGIYKAIPMRTSPRLRALKAVYKTYIDVVHVEKTETARLFSVAPQATGEGPDASLGAASPSAIGIDVSQLDAPLLNTTDDSAAEREAHEGRLKALAAQPDVYEKLTQSIAPGIWQLDDIKKGLLCQLFGGTGKSFKGGKLRGELNVLLVGDPGTSKSQLLGYVHNLAPRGIYTSGRGSSAVGLTAYVTRDPETRETVLESGALVLSDQGVCCIDEFDKMSDAARSMLHEVMEQQTVSVAKAGIISSLNARTSVLASANPVGSRYNPRASIVDNIQLPPTLLSRFDLIYLMLDKADEAGDRTLARHLISMFHETPSVKQQGIIPVKELKEYIAYARAHCNPRLTDESAAALVQGYLHMRGMGTSRKVITATPRQLESGVRLAESLARMRLSPTVEPSDVAEGLRLMQVAMQQSAVDPSTGTIDMDLIQTGISAGDRQNRAHLATELHKLLSDSGRVLTLHELQVLISQQSSVPVTETAMKDALRELSDKVTVNWSAQTAQVRQSGD